MKNALLTLLFLTGMAATQISAQSTCTPAPNCLPTPASCASGKSTASTDKDVKAVTASTVACTPEQVQNCKPAQEACGPVKTAAPTCKAAPACNEKAASAGKQTTSKAVAVREKN